LTNQNIVSLKDIEVIPGVTDLKDIEITNGPLLYIDYIKISGASNISAMCKASGAWAFDLQIINNTWTKHTITIEVYGTVINAADSSITVNNNQMINDVGLRTLSLKNELIQDQQVAKVYANSLLNILSDPGLIFQADTRGNPVLELFDIIELSNSGDNINNIIMSPTRLEYTYDGGLEVAMQGRKPIVPITTAFINASQIIKVTVPIKEGLYN
jgi:hypothetical protein